MRLPSCLFKSTSTSAGLLSESVQSVESSLQQYWLVRREWDRCARRSGSESARQCPAVKRDSGWSWDGEREGEKKEEKTKAESDDRGIKGEREVNGQVNGALQCQHSHLRGRESVGIYQCNTWGRLRTTERGWYRKTDSIISTRGSQRDERESHPESENRDVWRISQLNFAEPRVY